MIAALYVETGGAYFGLPDVDPWDEQRDARLYAGPHPVVAHPPCNRWCQMANVNQARYGQAVGDDGGCFAAALAAVRRFGGVLEHPAYSMAWPAHDLPRPPRGGWAREMFGPGWVTEVSQSAYGHRARKRTWLYFVGAAPPALDWSDAPGEAWVSWGDHDRYPDVPRLGKVEAKATPPAFRELLIRLAQMPLSARLPGIEPGIPLKSAKEAPGAESVTTGDYMRNERAGDRVRTGDIQLGKVAVSSAGASEPGISGVFISATTAEQGHGGPDRDR